MIEPKEFTAKEAFERSKAASRILANKEIEEIIPLIKDACSKGETEIDYSGILSQHGIKRLRELGYMVNKISTISERYTINWGEYTQTSYYQPTPMSILDDTRFTINASDNTVVVGDTTNTD